MLALGMTSEIYLLEHVLQMGVAMVTSELRKGGVSSSILRENIVIENGHFRIFGGFPKPGFRHG